MSTERNQHNTPWSPARVELARKLYVDEGKSPGEVAKALGNTTRNAVIGMLHRRGYARTETVGQLTAKITNAASAAAGRKTGTLEPALSIDSDGPKPARPVLISGPLSSSRNLTIADPGFRSHRCCKWPTGGEGADTTFCAVPADGIYCRQHAARAFTGQLQLSRKKNQRDISRLLRRSA